jgi:cobalt/nickel transport system permease protein
MLKRVAIALPFILFAGISNLFFDRGTLLVILGVPVSAGLVSIFVLITKAILCVGAAMILMATTPSRELFSQLRSWKVPEVLVTTVQLCLRYLMLLLAEARQMALAYHLRGCRQKGVELRHTGSFFGQLLLRSFDRAERVYRAMALRGNGFRFACDIVGKPTVKQAAACIMVCASIVLARVCALTLMALMIGR